MSGLLNVASLWSATRRVRGQDGASMVEYALLLGLVAVVAIGALVLLGGSVSNIVNNTGNDFRP